MWKSEEIILTLFGQKFRESNVLSKIFYFFQVLLLMPYHKTTVLQMMNDHLESGFSQDQVIKIFCDICKAVSRLHHCQTPIIHRDLKVWKQKFREIDFTEKYPKFFISGGKHFKVRWRKLCIMWFWFSHSKSFGPQQNGNHLSGRRNEKIHNFVLQKSWNDRLIFRYTVWKFQNFAITQILSEINFGDSTSAKSAILTHWRFWIFIFY